ncbi:hypothetical protein BDF20DRAFT_1001349 [Mycotypha africana]|uniref:uncharacterized protein n=1 Tax=Mycotypha africana TaxID=64632 RepID=UPI0023009AB0|nr:uncharacterized protein BDF20DRAFT_1001349 [Mycotypha africana]KAI8977342.1 hypothetical protein BDF20DRAFT_1001349 [Mycotypha africana]
MSASSSKTANAGGSASKKIRMTMACERCRAKKVKCDFTHPQCSRCQHAKVECSYDGSATQIDLFNLVKLNETVDVLQEKLRTIETNLKDVCNNTQIVADEVRAKRESNTNDKKRKSIDPSSSCKCSSDEENQHASSCMTSNITKRNVNGLGLISSPRSAQWSLSLTPKGLRIDTDIVSLHDLYDILLSGVSHFDFGNSANSNSNHSVSEAAASTLETSSQSSISTSFESPRPEAATVMRKKPLWKSRMKAHPLYSSWEPENQQSSTHNNMKNDNERWGIEKSNIDVFIQTISRETKQRLLTIFEECFLCFSWPDPVNSIVARFEKNTLDPMLANAIFAWTARHAAIYHNLFPNNDPNDIGHYFFLKAKELLKERFMVSNVNTMLSVFVMYIYAIGMPTSSSEHKAEVESEAYIYLGLAIRICLDLKMNVESTSSVPYEKELNRRFFWVLYFIETLGSIHSDKAFCLPPKEMISVGFPTLMDHETSGELKYKREFIINRFKIACIYRDIINKTTEEKPLLSQITAIDKELETWRSQLPPYFKYEAGDLYKRNWDSTSFREQACIKLNFEYNFQLCQLHGMFLKSSLEEGSGNSSYQPSTIELLSKDVCIKAAHSTIELLQCWAQLKQLWCHFSLENLMMTVVIYGNVLAQSDESAERDLAKTNLEKMAEILLSSPVRHHKYVLTLVNKIQAVLKEAANVDSLFDEESKGNSQLHPQHKTIDNPTSKRAGMSNSEKDTSSSNQNVSPVPVTVPSTTSTSIPVVSMPHYQQQNQTNILHKQPMSGVDQNLMPHAASDNPFMQSRNPFVLDVASASSIFDIHKADLFAQDMQPFSDFLYTPTILNDYDTSLNDTNIMSTMRSTTDTNNKAGTANSYLSAPPPSHTQPYNTTTYTLNQQQQHIPGRSIHNTSDTNTNTTPPNLLRTAVPIKSDTYRHYPQHTSQMTANNTCTNNIPPTHTNSPQHPANNPPYQHYHHHSRTDSSSSTTWVPSINGSPAPANTTTTAASAPTSSTIIPAAPTSDNTAPSRSSPGQPMYMTANGARPPLPPPPPPSDYMQLSANLFTPNSTNQNQNQNQNPNNQPMGSSSSSGSQRNSQQHEHQRSVSTESNNQHLYF